MRSLFIVLIALCVACASAATCSVGTPFTFSSTSTVGSASKLVLSNKLGFSANIQYVYTTGTQLGVDVSGCVDATLASKLGFKWTTSADTITLSAVSDGTASSSTSTTGTPGGQVSPTSGASKNVAPLTTFVALAFGLLLAFRPKSASSVVMILAILGVAVYAQADTTTSTITIKITVPDSILSVCSDAATCTARTPGNVDFINVLGDRYSTMDQGNACDTSKVMSLPDGWRIASASDSTVFAAIAFNSWGVDALILADGTAYTNNKNNVAAGSSAFKTVDNSGSTGYQVNTCNQRILIIQSFAYTNTKPNVVATISVSSFVTFGGFDYASADNVAYNSASSGSQSGGIYIPTSSAWQVATDDDSSAVALAKNSPAFGCSCAVFANGNAYTSNFQACGTSQLISVTTSGGVIVGTAGSKQRIVVRRSSSASNSFVATNIITNTVALGSNEYATLDNYDPYLLDSNNCQSRFLALPAGFAITSWADLSTFATLANAKGGIYPNTSVLVVSDTTGQSSQYRDGASATVKLVTKVSGGVTYYNTDSCGRILISRTNAAQSDFTLGLKLLFISQSLDSNAGDSGEVTLFNTMMQATGTPFDWVYLTNANYNAIYSGSLPLYDAAGNPKYYGIVMSLVNPKYPGGGEILTANQKDQIAQYQFLYGVRRVCLNGYPTDYSGITAGGSNQQNGTYMSIATSFANAHNDLFSGVNSTAVFNTSNQYFSWVGSVGSSYTMENMLDMRLSTADNTPKIVAGIITRVGTKVQTLQYFVGNADFLDHGPVLANVWLTWVTRGVWLGNRRIYFSPQIDDYFLSTGQYGQPDVAAHSVRITGADVTKTAAYLDSIKTKVPANSHVTLAMAVNCGEANLAPELVTAAQTYIDYFFWESHTWTHLDLTKNPEEYCDLPVDNADHSRCHNTTYDEASLELSKNNDYVKNTLFPTKGLDTPSWSKNAMITPAITGLFNAAAIKALLDNGMECVVGDNSRPAELLPPNPYLGMWTTKEFNGLDGLFILPRYATEIYYNSATPANNMMQYNERYGPNRLPQFTKQFFNFNSTLDDLLAREAEVNFRHLAFFRHDPYMFHQCNLAHFPYTYVNDGVQKDWSLATLWVQSMIDRYNQMLTFPLLGVKQTDLFNTYLARNSRETCGLSGTLSVVGGQTTRVQLSSTGACEASLTGPSSCGSLSASDCRTEQYANDNTVWAQMVAGSGKMVPYAKAWSN